MKISVSTLCIMLLALTTHAQFVHPGMLHNAEDLAFLKSRVASGEEPWASSWATLQASPEAALSWQPKPREVIVVGFYSKPDLGATDFRKDGNAAYTMSLQYVVTGNKAYADKAIEILNAWSYTLDSVTHDNRKLLVGMEGVKYLNAAELIKHTYSGWQKPDQRAFESMVLDKWYALIEDFMPGYNGNWDASMIQTMLCIGIFLDRADIFERAYQHALRGHTNGAINNYFNDWGQCQESGRDQGHTQMGLGFLSAACEIAWKQGRDLYSAYDNRLALGYEYTARYMLGEEVRYEQYTTFQGKKVFGDAISDQGRGRFHPVYERAYHHYHDRRGMDMPYTRQVLKKSRPEGSAGIFMPWSTLTTARYPIR